MIIAVLANEVLKQEILSKKKSDAVTFIWADSLSSLLMTEADAYFDLQFDSDGERISRLKRLTSSTVFVNAVAITSKETNTNFIRVNAWPGMLQREIIEVSASKHSESVEAVFLALGWKYLNVPDIPGFVTARVIAMIINEAYFTFEAGISSKADIDTAMKLGTNYPYGPFEWGEKIGLENVAELLGAMAKTDSRYEISKTLSEEAQLSALKQFTS